MEQTATSSRVQVRCAPLVTSAETPEAAHGRGALMLSTGGRRRLGTHGHSSSHPAVVHGSLRGCCCCCCVDCMLSNGAITSASHTHTDTHARTVKFSLFSPSGAAKSSSCRCGDGRSHHDCAPTPRTRLIFSRWPMTRGGSSPADGSSTAPRRCLLFFFFFSPACLPRYETTR